MKDSYVFYKDKLNAEYKSAFEQVEMYVSFQTVDQTTSEERLGELLDIFLSAQDAGKPVQSIVGGNLEEFCKTFCSDFGVKNRVLLILDRLKSTAWLLAVFSLIDILLLLLDTADGGHPDIWHNVSSLNISSFFTAFAVSAVMFIATNAILSHVMFRLKRVSMSVFKAIVWIEAGISFAAMMLILENENIHLFDVPAWIVAAVSVLYLAIYYLLFGKRIKRRKVDFAEVVPNGIRRDLDVMLQKKIEKVNRKRLKKGLGERPIEEFIADEELACNRIEKQKPLYVILPIVITVIACIAGYLNGEFEGYAEMAFFAIVILVVEYFIMRGLWSVVKTSLKIKREWIKEKRREQDQPQETQTHD